MPKLKNSTSFAGAAGTLLTALACPAFAQTMELTGTPALTGMASQVTGILSVEETGRLDRTLELTMTDAETGDAITDFDVELTQELHVIGTDSNFSTFIHEHTESAAPDGRLQVDVSFPTPGFFHIYTDAVPTGLGQQVLRFDLRVGAEQEASSIHPEIQRGDVLSSVAGPYQVELDISDLRAGEEAEVTLEILKDGQPAEDLAPYLDVPAHAVFIATDDLAYVHAHATSADGGAAHGAGGHEHASHDAGREEAVAQQDAGVDSHAGHGTATTDTAAQHGGDADGHARHGGESSEAVAQHGSETDNHSENGAAETEEAVPASLRLHVTPPAPGTYALWIQFMGGGEVRTAPFMIGVE